MKLHRKMLTFIATTTVVLMLILLFFSNTLLIGGFLELEEKMVSSEVQRAQYALAKRLNDIDDVLLEWSNWDDTYRFLDDHNEEYISTNLEPANSTIFAKFNTALIYDLSGELVYGRFIDLATKKEIPIPKQLAHFPFTSGTLQGILPLPEGPMLVVARPVLPTNGEGPIQGYFVLCKYLDGIQLAHLSKETQLSLSVCPVSQTYGDFRIGEKGLKNGSNVFIVALDDERVAGFSYLLDIFGRKSYILKVESYRAIYQQGQTTILYIIEWLLGIGIAYSIVVFTLFGICVIKRLYRLNKDVNTVELSTDLSVRVAVDSDDEFGDLARNINSMLSKIQHSERLLRQAHDELEKRVEERTAELHEANQLLIRYQILADYTRDIILFVQRDGRIVEANSAAQENYGYSREAMLQMRINNLRADSEAIDTQLEEAYTKGILFECWHKRSDGTEFPVEVNAQSALIGEDKIILSVIRDITERKETEKQLQFLATYDSLTRIPNRYSLEKELIQYLKEVQNGFEGVLLFIDVDNFKLVNDTFGHTIGDEILIGVSNKLKYCIRPTDFLARLGGNEYGILLRNTSIESAKMIAERIRHKLDNSKIHDLGISLTISIGVVALEPELDPQKLLTSADIALYSAKESGKNRVVIIKPGEPKSTLTENNTMLHLIKNAIEDNRFFLLFQPVRRLKNGVSHYEALLRMKDKDGSIISPGVFIPLAEKFGLMSHIDRWVLENAVTILQERNDISLFINISGKSLGDTTLLEYIQSYIKLSKIEPCRLGFEITETAAITDTSLARYWIDNLKNLGCKFALDDFGIGFSSFSYLQSLPVDFVKIDGIFISDIATNYTHHKIVEAMNSIAHALGKETVVEYVENENALRILSEIKVDYCQGYHIGKPGPLLGC